MSKVPPFLQSLLAGGLAAAVTSILLWLFTQLGLFSLLSIPVAAPLAAGNWIAWRIVWGCIFGLFFFVPMLTDLKETFRGLIVALVPILKLLVWDYPRGPEGWFGLNYGINQAALLVLTVVVTWAIWGLLAGALLDWWDFTEYEPEE